MGVSDDVELIHSGARGCELEGDEQLLAWATPLLVRGATGDGQRAKGALPSGHPSRPAQCEL